MKGILLGLLVLTLSGCAKTHVHLYGRYLQPEQIKNVSEALEAEGYQVKVNQFAFPRDIQQSSLIYSLMLRDVSKLDTVLGVATEQGWYVNNISALVKGNHWYTKDSMGLFLLPDGVDPTDPTAPENLSFLYQSVGCDKAPSLQLFSDNTFRIQPVAEVPFEDDWHQGSWELKESVYLTLTPKADKTWSYYLQLERRTEQDQLGKAEVIQLTPMRSYLMFGTCNFEYGVRS
ncbi:hypothetical protein [Bowmanella pacifica]|uniref:Lipoprotein n=1 Tax=Bowmanella pacifica TaxID=502051 RepID=A0A918DIE0_9ALTE|nr:hypothetical protein [Bowmanella pacifica]GGO67806.1 hypothetical protein GCM10010982_15220 [Bowmanella pacifica]